MSTFLHVPRLRKIRFGKLQDRESSVPAVSKISAIINQQAASRGISSGTGPLDLKSDDRFPEHFRTRAKSSICRNSTHFVQASPTLLTRERLSCSARPESAGPAQGGTKCAGGGLENRFGNVMAVAAVGHENVDVAQDVRGEGVPEVGDQFAVELADLGRGKFGIKDEVGPSSKIDCAGGQRLVHRQREVAVAADAGPVAQGLAHGLPQADAHVLDRVMLIDVQVALGLD